MTLLPINYKMYFLTELGIPLLYLISKKVTLLQYKSNQDIFEALILTRNVSWSIFLWICIKEKLDLANFWVISCKITKIMGIGHEQDFKIQN